MLVGGRFNVWALAIGLVCNSGCRIDFESKPRDANGSVDATTDANGGPLISRGALVRYFLDEAASGQAEPTVHDAITPALDLAMRYDTATEPLWIATATGRALAFPTIELNGGACSPIVGTKVLSTLAASATGSIEVVVDLTVGSGQGSRLLHIGADQRWGFSMGYSSEGGEPPLIWFGGSFASTPALTSIYRFWPVDLATKGRTVLTIVYDASAANDTDRARLYINGVFVAFDAFRSQGQLVINDTIAVDDTQYICIGNRFVGVRTPVGNISYAAMYSSALTATEVLANVTRLLTWDDR